MLPASLATPALRVPCTSEPPASLWASEALPAGRPVFANIMVRSRLKLRWLVVCLSGVAWGFAVLLGEFSVYKQFLLAKGHISDPENRHAVMTRNNSSPTVDRNSSSKSGVHAGKTGSRCLCNRNFGLDIEGD